MSNRGEVLCEIYNYLYNNNSQGQFANIIKRGNSPQDHVSNFQLLLTSFPENETVMRIIGGKRLEEVYRVVFAYGRHLSSSWR